VLANDWRVPRNGRSTEIDADLGLVVEEVGTDWCGEIVRVERDLGTVTLEDRRRKRRTFPLGPGFMLEGRPVVLVAPTRAGPAAATRTASGSVAVHGVKARVARASRIYVEGRHDAELVEKVWGDDLRIEGVVVEYLDGADDLGEKLLAFGPAPERRVGVLLDHLVPGSKESRIVAAVTHPDVLITGHPYVDVWQAVKPERVGIREWPVIPPGRPWKEGVCAAVGIREPAEMWRRILASVSSYKDVETPLINSMERLIDFVTEPA
jgi:hypothetical protein